MKTYKMGTGPNMLHISSITDGIVFTIMKNQQGDQNYLIALDIDGNIKSSKTLCSRSDQDFAI